MRRHLFVVLCFHMLLLPVAVNAGNFKVAPVTLSFAPEVKTTAVTLVNQGDEPVTVQVEAKEWHQSAQGEDQYTPSGDLIFFPKIVTLPKGGQATIRVGYQKERGAQARNFRLFLQELPVTESGKMAIKMLLSLAVPVFIEPMKTTEAWEIAGVTLGQGELNVSVKNAGNRYIRNDKLQITGLNDTGSTLYTKNYPGWYVLPGITKIYALDFPKELCLQSKLFKVEALNNQQVKTLHLTVDPSHCTDRPETAGKKKQPAPPRE